MRLHTPVGALLLTCSVISGHALADGPNEIDAYLYLSGKAEWNFDRSKNEIDQSKVTPSADLLLSDSSGAFRVLAEYLLTDDEHELERLQLGWAPSEETMIWIGRYHRPYSYGNTRLHHGQFLQMSIDRPALEKWEDDHGILPYHSTGLLAEWHHTGAAGEGLQIAAAVGADTEFDNGLEPLDVLDPEGGHKLGGDFRIAYLPDALGENQIGVSFSTSEMDVTGSDLNTPPLSQINQHTASVYTDWQKERWRLLSTLVYVRNLLDSAGNSESDQSFVVGFAQVQFEASDRWTMYARRENRWGDHPDQYLRYFPQSLSQASIVGVRLDFLRRQALTFEASRNHSPSDDYSQFRIQWSTVLQ